MSDADDAKREPALPPKDFFQEIVPSGNPVAGPSTPMPSQHPIMNGLDIQQALPTISARTEAVPMNGSPAFALTSAPVPEPPKSTLNNIDLIASSNANAVPSQPTEDALGQVSSDQSAKPHTPAPTAPTISDSDSPLPYAKWTMGPTHKDAPSVDSLTPEERRGVLVDKARQFLQAPDIRPQSEARKRDFLVNKGLEARDISKLLDEVAPPPPPVPPRSYPGYIKRRTALNILSSAIRTWMYITGSSAAVLFLYWWLILPRLSNTLAARTALQDQRLAQLEQLRTGLEKAAARLPPKRLVEGEDQEASHADSEKGETQKAEVQSEEKGRLQPPVVDLATRLNDLVARLDDIRAARTSTAERSETLLSATSVTGLISSKIYLPREYSSSGRWVKRSVLGPVEDEVRAEIRALKGLALNRKSFIATPSPPRPPFGSMSTS